MKAKIKVDKLPDAPEPTKAVRIDKREFDLSRYGKLKKTWKQQHEGEYLEDMKELDELENEKQKGSSK